MSTSDEGSTKNNFFPRTSCSSGENPTFVPAGDSGWFSSRMTNLGQKVQSAYVLHEDFFCVWVWRRGWPRSAEKRSGTRSRGGGTKDLANFRTFIVVVVHVCALVLGSRRGWRWRRRCVLCRGQISSNMNKMLGTMVFALFHSWKSAHFRTAAGFWGLVLALSQDGVFPRAWVNEQPKSLYGKWLSKNVSATSSREKGFDLEGHCWNAPRQCFTEVESW